MIITHRQTRFVLSGGLLCLLPFGFLLATDTLLWQRCLSAAAILACLLAGVSLLQNRKHPLRVTWNDLFVSLYMAYGGIQYIIHRNDLPGSVFASWTVVVALYLVARNSDTRALPAFLWAASLPQSLVALGQLLDVFPSTHGLYAVTGTFWNPSQLGGFLACLAPLLVHDIRSRKRRLLFLGLSAFPLAALVLSDSRAAWLACLIGTLYVLRLEPKTKLQTGIVAAAVLVAGVALWFYKPLSALGRFHLWKITGNMAADAPLFGGGLHSFPRLYMPYQGFYFECHPDDAFADTATVVTTPYNEFLHILVEQGLIGLSLFLLLCGGFLLRPGEENRKYTAVLLSFLVFSCFSYPGENVALLAVLACCMGAFRGRAALAIVRSRAVRLLPVAVPVLALCLNVGVFVRYRILARIVYASTQEIHVEAFRNEPDALQCLALRYPPLPPDKHKRVLELLAARCPSPNSYCTLAIFCEQNGEIATAEKLYRQAALMVPNQIRANYRLFNLYKNNGQTEAAYAMALRLVRQRVKIENSFTLEAQGEATRYLKRHKHDKPNEIVRQPQIQ